MGHIGIKGLHHAVEGLHFTADSTPICSVCTIANVKHMPFPHTSQCHATRVLECIHSDICGPLHNGYTGYKYFALFIDKYTRFTTVYCLTKQSEISRKFKEWKAAVKNFHHTTIIFLHVDNASKFVEGDLKLICKKYGITYERTVPDMPQQNRKAEWHNYTFACMACTMLLNAGLSKYFWPFTIQTAIYL